MSVGRVLTYAAMVAAIVMLLGSCDYKTQRDFDSSAKHADDFDADEFDQWAALTSFASLLALALLGNVVATIAPRTGGPSRSTAKASAQAAVALALFALGATTAWRHWMVVIAEQQRAEYVVHIAYGLPTVTYAGILGAALCTLLTLALLTARRQELRPRPS